MPFECDDENRLAVVTYSPSAVAGPMLPTPTGGWKAEFTYDGVGRLRIRRDYYSTSTGYFLTNTTCYLYDGNRVIQERDSANVPQVSYTRGQDMSGSLEGAGGIGGLLARSHGYSGGTWSTHNYYHADAGGNVTYMANSSQGMVASYKYDPFGRLLNSSGSLAGANLYRFSSKEFHVNSGLYYYLYRFYDPGLQRWLNRDPEEEDGGNNLYRYAANDAINHTDGLGLMPDGPTVGEMGAAECNRQNIQCNRDCMKRPAPYPWGNYPPGPQRRNARRRYCEEKC